MTDVTGLDELRAMPPGPERVAAVQAWIPVQRDLIKQARRLRNADVRALCAEHGPAETARMLGMALSTVKSIRGTE